MMIELLLGAALLGQSLSLPRGYTLADPVYVGVGLQSPEPALDLATADGVFVIGLGPGCDGIAAGENVEVVYGSGDVATINQVGSEQRCQVIFALTLSEQPCATGPEGVCDIDALDNAP